MLHVILLIFKIIGITLLILLGTLLLVLLIVLLVPIRYRVAIEHGDEFSMEGRVYWLFHLLNARITHLEGKLHIRVRILWFVLYDNLRPKKLKIKKAKQKAVMKKKKTTVNGKTVKAIKSPAITEKRPEKHPEKYPEKHPEKPSEKYPEKHQENHKLDETGKEQPKKTDGHTVEMIKNDGVPIMVDIKAEDRSPENELKENIFQRIYHKVLAIKERVITFYKNIKNKLIHWFETAKNIKDKAGLIIDFIRNDLNKEGFSITFESIKKLLKHILPTKLSSRVVFGTGDPCSTGQALGAIGFLYSFYGDKVQIIPDFENKIFEGKHYARGRIRLVTILIIVIKLILDKRFKVLKNNFQILKEAL